MISTRRTFLAGLGAALAAPAVIRTPGLLMPVRSIVLPPVEIYVSAASVDAGGGSADRPFRTYEAGLVAACRVIRDRDVSIVVAPGIYKGIKPFILNQAAVVRVPRLGGRALA